MSGPVDRPPRPARAEVVAAIEAALTIDAGMGNAEYLWHAYKPEGMALVLANAVMPFIDSLRAELAVARQEAATLAAVEVALDAFLAIAPARRYHAERPMTEADSVIVAAANADRWTGEPARSLKCWECTEQDDTTRWDATMTFGEYKHAEHDAFKALRAAHAALVAGTEKPISAPPFARPWVVATADHTGKLERFFEASKERATETAERAHLVHGNPVWIWCESSVPAGAALVAGRTEPGADRSLPPETPQ